MLTSKVNLNATSVATENNKLRNDIPFKSHLQFAHPLHKKLLKLLN